MKQKRYTEEQIVGIVKSGKAGKGIVEVCREAGGSEAMVHHWRKRYDGLDISEIRRMRSLEAKNSQMKRITAQQMMDIEALEKVTVKKIVALSGIKAAGRRGSSPRRSGLRNSFPPYGRCIRGIRSFTPRWPSGWSKTIYSGWAKTCLIASPGGNRKF